MCCREVKNDNVISAKNKKIAQATIKKSIIPAMKNLDIDYCMGKFSPSENKNFSLVDPQYADRTGLYMHTKAYQSFIKMYNHALKDGIKLVIKSATRNFDYQKGIWERKYTGTTVLSDGTNVGIDIKEPKAKALKILEYSSMPGTSRHHWGTDIDLNAFTNNYFENGKGLIVYNWLECHAIEYGFCQPYTPKGKKRPHGYNEEKWHWSYLPLSVEILDFAKQHLNNKMIKGFKGDQTTEQIDVVNKYILGVNKECK